MSAIAVIREELKVDFVVSTSESINNTVLDRWIVESIREHNSAYAVDGSNLPAREVPLIKLLAGSKLCTRRASDWANKNSISSSQGYSNDRDTPFSKLTRQSQLLIAEYNRQCVSMGISPEDAGGAGSITQGTLTKLDPDGYRTPYQFDTTVIPVPSLSLFGAAKATEATIQWTKSRDNTFADYIVFYALGANVALFDPSNMDSTAGIPRVSDDASMLSEISNPDQTALRVTGLTASTPYSFMVVVKNQQGKYAYSSVLTLTTTA